MLPPFSALSGTPSQRTLGMTSIHHILVPSQECPVSPREVVPKQRPLQSSNPNRLVGLCGPLFRDRYDAYRTSSERSFVFLAALRFDVSCNAQVGPSWHRRVPCSPASEQPFSPCTRVPLWSRMIRNSAADVVAAVAADNDDWHLVGADLGVTANAPVAAIQQRH